VEVGRRRDRRKRLRAACVPALQEHRPPPEVLPQYEENVDNWCRLLGTSSLKEGAMWHVLKTVARQTPRDMFYMWSDPSLLRNNGKAAFSTGSVPSQQ
jgi:hypothetical protein